MTKVILKTALEQQKSKQLNTFGRTEAVLVHGDFTSNAFFGSVALVLRMQEVDRNTLSRKLLG